MGILNKYTKVYLTVGSFHFLKCNELNLLFNQSRLHGDWDYEQCIEQVRGPLELFSDIYSL